MLDIIGEPVALALIGLVGGAVLGLAARMGRFCSLGAIEDALYGGDWTRMRMWSFAIGLAILGTFGAVALGFADIGRTAYLAQAWNPWASILGGLAFGYGMALAGNCGFGALARVGGGDFRSFVIVITVGLAAYATRSGPLAEWRVALFPDVRALEPQGIAHAVGSLTGVSPALPAFAVGIGLIAVALVDPKFRGSSRTVVWSAAVAIAIVSGWLGTTWVARHGFAATPILSHTFAAPLGESMLFVMTSSARSVSFGVGSVTGVLLGAFAGSLFRGHFRWEACEDPRELRRQIGGAVLMGAGAMVALGCTVGQGLSAFSVLAYSAPVTAAAIFAGAAVGLRQLITGFLPAE